MDESNSVSLTLTDLHPISNLFTKLKQKLSHQPIVPFSLQNFKVVDSISSDSFNLSICYEFNYLVTGCDNHIAIYDLLTHKPIFERIECECGVYGIDLEREHSGKWNLIISSRNNQVLKFDFSKILSEKRIGEPIYKIEREFDHVWAVRCFKTELYVVDYQSKVFVFDLKTGVERTDIIVDLKEGMVDLIFTPNEEMIVCGLDVFHILKFNSQFSTWEIIKTYSNDTQLVQVKDCYCVWYERKTKLIYISDGCGKMFIFDREFNLLREITSLESPYGIVINEQNGEMFVCETTSQKITIYK
ncbi:predicted protein [Naegleria gruberi]|uniref:Predicted protein n=1 Tax=Naegleria gruberi TaxID=5762 RepID=D2VBW7_NAEGR|nr:uncharacterized protein NAEGRDRAFT_66361 [Naegleria gruberi]EFC45550.1 predicted protein [Naegleria gruberi]|eukprot:XP_002678294.1 predicted protein [Naegleria gruberi strain NEG-M]